jgi:hypothetical protein
MDVQAHGRVRPRAEAGGEQAKLRPPLASQGWFPYKVHYRYVDTFYHMSFIRDGPGTEVVSVTLDGAIQSERMLTLTDGRRDHYVEVRMGLGLRSESKGQG